MTEEIENMRFNTAISAMMEFINAANKVTNIIHICSHIIKFHVDGYKFRCYLVDDGI